MIGTVVGDYKITDKLGEGRFGVVWQALDLPLDRVVALKMMDPVLARDASFRQSFLSRVRTQARLVHPNIMSTYHVFEHDGCPCAVLECVPRSLLSRIIEGLTVTAGFGDGIFEQVLRAVGYAHRAGVVHGNLSPDKVLSTSDGTTKLSGFGTASIPGVASPVTPERTREGALGYAAPELLLGQLPTVQSDIYSIGAMLFEETFGSKPTVPSDAAVVGRRSTAGLLIRGLRDRVRGRALAGALAALPAERFKTCDEFLAVLIPRERRNREIAMPQLVGSRIEDVEVLLSCLGMHLLVVAEHQVGLLPAGRVIAQEPQAGEEVGLGRGVAVEISADHRPEPPPALDPEASRRTVFTPRIDSNTKVSDGPR